MTDYSAAAAALEVPESLVRRSAEARAKADNVSVDELVTAWAGGGTAPAAQTTPAESSPVPPEPSAAPEPAESAPAPAAAPVPAVAPAPAPAVRSGVPPVLVGARQSTTTITAGAIGLLLLSILIGFLVPSLPQPENGVRSSNHAFSTAAQAGQKIYLEQGCGSCHTQLIRAVVADANLGPVTLSDSNQFFGYRRVGPDLAAIGARIASTNALVALITADRRHPSVTGVSEEALGNLLAYLRESR